MDINFFIGTDLERVCRKCEDEILKRQQWLINKDYTEGECEPIKNDIKRFKAIIKQIKKTLSIYEELETY